MKLKPGIESLDTDNVNVSHTSPLREFAILLVSAFALLALVYVLLGLLIDRAVDWIDPATEKAVFGQLSSALDDGTPPTNAEASLQDLVNRIQQCLDPGYQVEVDLVAESAPNAFALPGGRMIVTQGLIDQMESENGLAFVLAHELGHFANRDHLRGLGRGVVLAALSSIVLGTDSGLDAVFAPASMAGQARFSRERESDADRVSLGALQCHYQHVSGADAFFRALKTAGYGDESEPAYVHFFASHPDVDSRIASLKRLSREAGYASGRERPLPEALQ